MLGSGLWGEKIKKPKDFSVFLRGGPDGSAMMGRGKGMAESTGRFVGIEDRWMEWVVLMNL